ncbi:glycosyltransferase, partial [Akkermansia sp.]
PLPQEKEQRVLFVGRLDNSVKGVDRLLRIWARAGKSLPDWHLDIVGDGPDAAALKELAERLRLSNVSFEGFRNPAPYYRRASIFCMTSTFEGFGLVLPEAMQHGCVPMAFNSYAAVRDLVIPGKTGILAPPFDEEEYARQLLRLMQDAPLRSAMAQAGPQHAALFSPANVVREWNSLLQH